MEFKLSSKAFKNGEYIPDLYSYTRLGKNISPPLNWENPPEQTKSFAIILKMWMFRCLESFPIGFYIISLQKRMN